MSDQRTAGDFNQRQMWNPRGFLYLVGTLNAGGYAVFRFNQADPGHAVVASQPLPDEAAAVAEADRLRREALN